MYNNTAALLFGNMPKIFSYITGRMLLVTTKVRLVYKLRSVKFRYIIFMYPVLLPLTFHPIPFWVAMLEIATMLKNAIFYYFYFWSLFFISSIFEILATTKHRVTGSYTLMVPVNLSTYASWNVVARISKINLIRKWLRKLHKSKMAAVPRP